MPEIDYEGEVRSFEADVHALRAGARSCVGRFRSTTDDNLLYLFAERLGGLGSLAVPILYELVLDDPFVTRFVEGRTLEDGDLADRTDDVRAMLATLHGCGETLPSRFDPVAE